MPIWSPDTPLYLTSGTGPGMLVPTLDQVNSSTDLNQVIAELNRTINAFALSGIAAVTYYNSATFALKTTIQALQTQINNVRLALGLAVYPYTALNYGTVLMVNELRASIADLNYASNFNLDQFSWNFVTGNILEITSNTIGQLTGFVGVVAVVTPPPAGAIKERSLFNFDLGATPFVGTKTLRITITNVNSVTPTSAKIYYCPVASNPAIASDFQTPGDLIGSVSTGGITVNDFTLIADNTINRYLNILFISDDEDKWFNGQTNSYQFTFSVLLF